MITPCILALASIVLAVGGFKDMRESRRLGESAKGAIFRMIFGASVFWVFAFEILKRAS